MTVIWPSERCFLNHSPSRFGCERFAHQNATEFQIELIIERSRRTPAIKLLGRLTKNAKQPIEMNQLFYNFRSSGQSLPRGVPLIGRHHFNTILHDNLTTAPISSMFRYLYVSKRNSTAFLPFSGWFHEFLYETTIYLLSSCN